MLFKGDVGSEELVASPVGTRTLRKPRVAAGRSPRSLSPPPPFINPTPHCSYPPRLLAMHCRKLVFPLPFCPMRPYRRPMVSSMEHSLMSSTPLRPIV